MSEKVSSVTDSSFEKEVLQSNKPVLVDFWADWCAPCRMLAPTIDAIAEQFGENAGVVKVNVDDNTSTAQRYGIKGIPTLILLQDRYSYLSILDWDRQELSVLLIVVALR